MGQKTFVIKCQKCKKIYTGQDLDRMILDYNLKPAGKGYVCDCPGEFQRIEKKEKKRDGFFQQPG